MTDCETVEVLKCLDEAWGPDLRIAHRDGEVLVCAMDLARTTDHAKWDSALRLLCQRPPVYLREKGNRVRYLPLDDAYRVLAGQRGERAVQVGSWLFGSKLPALMAADSDSSESDGSEESRTVSLARRVLASASEDAARAARAPRNIIAKMKAAAVQAGSGERACALSDALAVLDEVA